VKRLSAVIASALMLAVALLTVAPARAAFVDFEGYAILTNAAALTEPGITFSGTGWDIYTGYANAPYVTGNALGAFTSTLTMTFSQPQSSVTYGSATGLAYTATAYRNGAVVDSVNVGAGTNMFVTLTASEIDTVTLTAALFNTAIDNITTTPSGVACGIGDGRINSESCAGPVALYCGDNGLEVWDVAADGVGSLAFTFSGSFETPSSNALLMSASDIQLWQLDTGEFQVNADAGEGKTYAFVFNGCPYDGGGYNANIDPNE